MWNKDEAKGKADVVAGRFKQSAADLIEDEKLKAAGEAQEARGKVQAAVGKVERKVGETVKAVKDVGSAIKP